MNLPTKLTILRILMIPVFVAVFFINFPYHRWVACGIFALASFTDFLDGYIARKYNLVTDLGKFLDPIADKILVACALIALCLDSGIFQIAICIFTMIILSRELMISGFRIVASSKNVVLAADKLGKIKTVLQMVAIMVLLVFTQHIVGFCILALATLMTIISGINYLVKNKSVLKD